MGGNTFNRKYYNDYELDCLLEKVNGWSSLFDDRIFTTYSRWRVDISRHLDSKCINRFYYKYSKITHGDTHCKICNAILQEHDFNGSTVNNGFNIHCDTCVNNHAWCRKENLSPTMLDSRGKNISKAKTDYYNTPAGEKTKKAIGEKNSKLMKEFYNTEEGKAVKKSTSEKLKKTMTEKKYSQVSLRLRRITEIRIGILILTEENTDPHGKLFINISTRLHITKRVEFCIITTENNMFTL